MASTGVAVSDAAIADFNDFKANSNKTTFVIFKINGGVIEKEHSSLSTDFSEFTALLPADDGRYAVYKMDFVTTDGRPNTKLVFISWAPDAAKVKAKMVYAGSKDALSRVLVGISVKVHATDLGELTVSGIQDACRKF